MLNLMGYEVEEIVVNLEVEENVRNCVRRVFTYTGEVTYAELFLALENFEEVKVSLKFFYEFNHDSGLWERHENLALLQVNVEDILSGFFSYIESVVDNKFRGVILKKRNNLTKQSFMERVVRRILLKCRSSDVDLLFVEKENTLCFKNGLYDFKTREFRNYCPTDYCVKTLSFDYVRGFYSEDFNAYMLSLFFGSEEFQYFLWVLFNSLNGQTANDLIYFFLGDGANGKSSLILFLKNAFQHYVAVLDSGFLASDNTASSGAREDLMQLDGARLCFLSEPSTKRFDIMKVKKLCGNENISARGIYSKTKTFRAKGKFFILANQFPDTNTSTDFAFWRRVKIVPFSNCFSSNPAVGAKKIDEELQSKIYSEIFIKALYSAVLDFHEKTPEPSRFIAAKETLDGFVPEKSLYITSFIEVSNDGVLTFKEIYARITKKAEIIRNKEYDLLFQQVKDEISRAFKKEIEVKTVGGKSLKGWFGLKLKD